MSQGLTKRSALEIVAKNSSSVILSLITALVAVNPFWAVLFVLAQGMITTWGDFGTARMKDLVDDLVVYKNQFVPKLLESDEFKAVFLNVVDRQLKETNEEKRKLFRNYLINNGICPPMNFNYHSKALLILDQITLEELNVLNALAREQRMNRDNHDAMNENQIMSSISSPKPSMSNLQLAIRMLNNYGLISALDIVGGIVGPGSDGVSARYVTEFGDHFLRYVKDPADFNQAK